MNNILAVFLYSTVFLLLANESSIAQVGVNTSMPQRFLEINTGTALSEGIRITSSGFYSELLSEGSGANALVLRSSTSSGQMLFRFDTANRMRFTASGFFPLANATDNIVSGALDIGRFDLHFRRVYTRGIHVNDNDVNGGLRINIGSGGNTTADYNFSDFAFYPVANRAKDLGRNGNFWNNLYFVSAFTPSDRRLKENIRPLNHALTTVNQLNVYRYHYRFEEKKRDHYGFMAQELQQILPELVSTGTDEAQTLAINYTEVIPVLVRAIQEQQKQLEAQQKMISQLMEAQKK